MADEEDEAFGGMYEDGHWVWDDNTEALVFVSDLPPVNLDAILVAPRTAAGAVEFRDDIDLIEQVRYKRRYQRKLKPGQANLVTLQDIKDLVIYTAPIAILTPMLINLLHLSSTERFLRALIFYCAYYLQIAEKMTERILELKTKIRTQTCEIVEDKFRENLSDLRVLVAKEYCVMLIGGGDMKKFHHMGANKKRQSLSDKDARLFETFVQMAIQIVYVALGRRQYRQIELECHRIFKSDTFNTVEHTYKTGYLAQMTPEERKVLLGTSLLRERKLNTRSPLLNEVFTFRPIDFRLLGLGVIKYEELSTRFRYLYLVVAGREEMLHESNLTVGIIGLPRASFDTILHPIQTQTGADKSKALASKSQVKSSRGSGSAKSADTKSSHAILKHYPDIQIPEKSSFDPIFPSDFPEKAEHVLPVSQIQRQRWLTRLAKLTQ